MAHSIHHEPPPQRLQSSVPSGYPTTNLTYIQKLEPSCPALY